MWLPARSTSLDLSSLQAPPSAPRVSLQLGAGHHHQMLWCQHWRVCFLPLGPPLILENKLSCCSAEKIDDPHLPPLSLRDSE